MVSKLAVIAIVAIVACPILIGYAMNIETVTDTTYSNVGNSLNVTRLLQQDNEYDYTLADTYALNTNLKIPASVGIPEYKLVSTTTSLPMTIHKYNNSKPSNVDQFSDYAFYYVVFDYDPASYDVTTIISADTLKTNHYVQSIYYDYYNDKCYVTCFDSGLRTVNSYSDVYDSATAVNYSGSFSGTCVTYLYDKDNPPTTFADISAGYNLNTHYTNIDMSIQSKSCTRLNLPDHTKNAIITLDLGSVTASSIATQFYLDGSNNLQLFKTTTGGDVKWQFANSLTDTDYIPDEDKTDLYYDPTDPTGNVYQLYMDQDGYEFRYIGGWPDEIGTSTYFMSFSGTWNGTSSGDRLDNIQVFGFTPTMRIDYAQYRSFQYAAITDRSFDPARYRENPATKIGNVIQYGTSIDFGGNNYAVSNGNLILGNHKVSLKNMVFDSVPISSGYANRINGNVVSETLTPSTITFNGSWVIDVNIDSMEQTTYTTTKWVAGDFGWNGIDHNFLLVGLFASLAAFVGVGIYAKKSRASLWPVMIVCGCAAALFFIML